MDFDEKTLVLLPKHVLFSMRIVCSRSYENTSLLLFNSLGKALTDFEDSQRKIFGINRKNIDYLIKQYFNQIDSGNNLKNWKELENLRCRSKKGMIISGLLEDGKSIENIHPDDYLDKHDADLKELVVSIEKIANKRTYLFDHNSNYLIKAM